MGDKEEAFIERLLQVVPSKRQLSHQRLEFYAFAHFSVNTFTGREWGDGTESPEIFAPTRLDAGQWVEAVKRAGMRGLILTCKHHDGFCLWPSRYTKHSVAASPFRDGKGDVVREVSNACKKGGIKFGVYLSPWDRNHPLYGSGKPYDDYFVNQLTELLTGYGEIFCVWLDGACGEGPDGRVQVYDWERYYAVIRRLQPGACITVCGPDVRWCGNEAGENRAEEWSVVSDRLLDARRIQERSQKTDNEEFRQKKISSMDQDLGSRQALKNEEKLIWYPAEVDVSIRPGWFYHEEEDGQVRSLSNLVDIYDKSVGGNATLLLNIPPTKEGLIHEADVKRLAELGEFLGRREAVNLAEKAEVSSGNSGEEWEMRICWKEPVICSMVILKEDIRFSQRIERFCILDGESQTVLYEGTTVGYQKNAGFGTVETKDLRIRILQSRGEPKVMFAGVYGIWKCETV